VSVRSIIIKRFKPNFVADEIYCITSYPLSTHVLLTNQPTNQLIPCIILLLENLTVAQLVKKFPVFYGIQRFITEFARSHR
jgi:hypothetical protein